MATVLTTRIQLRNDLMTVWAEHNPILLPGEVGYEVDTNKFKIGNGQTAWNDLEYFTTDANANIEQQIENILEAIGDAASTDEKTVYGYINAIDKKYQTAVSNYLPLTGGTMIGNIILTDGGFVISDKAVDEKINAFANYITDNGKVDTLRELIQYVEEHGGEVIEITGAIDTLRNLVGDKSVAEQIAVAGTRYENRKYEIVHQPAGTLVRYHDEEIRIMVPAGTKYDFQQGGAGSDPNNYYIGLKIYAPENAVYFREDDKEVLEDKTFYNYTDNPFAGIDIYGRKYSIAWLAVAKYVDGKWVYYGANSKASKYIGWHIVTEWYDADLNPIGADGIRINLSNEDCHYITEPYFMGSVIKQMSVNGALVEVINNKVDITTKDIIKETEEIGVDEEQNLFIKKLAATKLFVPSGIELVLNGGAAE